MATIASLDIALGANSTKLKRDLDRAAAQTESFAKKAKKNAEGVSAAFGGMVSALAALGVATAIKTQINFADTIGETAQKIGISTEALSAYTYAAKLSGVEAATLEKGISKLNRQMVDNGDLFSEMGVQVRNADGSYRQATDVMTDVADVLSKMPDGAEKSALAMEIFGKSGAELVPLLNQGSEGIERLTAEAAKFGLVISQDTADAAGTFNDVIDKLLATMQGIMLTTMAALAPAMESMSQSVLSATTAYNELDPIVKVITASLAALALAVFAIGAAFTLVGAIPLAIIAALAVAIAGIIYVVANWDSIMRTITEFLASTFGVSVDQVNSALSTMADWFWRIIDVTSQLVNWWASVLVGAIKIVISSIMTTIEVWSNLFQAIYNLFTLDFGGFGANMMAAFSAVNDWFASIFGVSISDLGTYLKDMFIFGLTAAAQAFVNAITDGINYVLNGMDTALRGIINAGATLMNSIPGMEGTIARRDTPLVAPITPFNLGGGAMPSLNPSTPSTPSTPFTGPVGGPGTFGVSPNTPNAADVATAENTQVIADALSDDGAGGGGAGGGGGGGKPKSTDVLQKAEAVSTEFLDTIKSSFSKLLATGDVKEFFTSIADKFTTGIIDEFSNQLMDALFGNVFDDIFKKFGETIKNGLQGAVNSASAGAGGGGGGGLLGGVFKWFGGLFTGFADGGLVPSTPYSKIGRDSVPAMLMPGELVVPVGEVGNYMNGGGVTNNINITGDISRQTRREIYSMLPEIAKGVNSVNHESGNK